MPRNGLVGQPDGDSSADLALELEILGSEPGNRPDAPAAPYRSDRLRCVLVVGGDAELRAYVRRCIENRCGWKARVVEAEAGLDALRLAGTERFDLIICDDDVAPSGGIELILALRAGSIRTVVPALLLTEGRLSGERRALFARAVGAAALRKPFNARKLCGAIQRLLAP